MFYRDTKWMTCLRRTSPWCWQLWTSRRSLNNNVVLLFGGVEPPVEQDLANIKLRNLAICNIGHLVLILNCRNVFYKYYLLCLCWARIGVVISRIFIVFFCINTKAFFPIVIKFSIRAVQYHLKYAHHKYSETSLIGPPCGPTLSGPINEVAPLLKTSLMRPLKVVALLTRFSKS